ncbi:MAG: type II toxin-antitoxin system RelE/ParE family toxin [bacterium]|nr:type II toxin-antitoxin system RelE/ParE family toxin [bacterium]MBU1918327.1 type II toxin-antitoxin system RelE/ParE family toxin [bacterium]
MKLPPIIEKGIRVLLEELQDEPYLGKALQRDLTGYRSVPFKRYRVIYKISDNQS